MSAEDFLIPPELATRIRSARRIAVLTGAGISAESGVPTFRRTSVPAAQASLWDHYDPQELATPQAFQRNPGLVWKWYAWRRDIVSKAMPNPGHFALAEMERRTPVFTLITQNVDGLHQRAGSGARFDVIELHGNIQRTKCFKCGKEHHLGKEHHFGKEHQENLSAESWHEINEAPPRCTHCGGMLRPDIVWFGEALPQAALQAAWEATRLCEIFLSIGTSGLVEPAASMPYLALEACATVVEINPDETALSHNAHFTLQGPSGILLPKLVQAAWSNS